MKGQAKISLFYKVSGGNLGAKREFSCPLYKSMRQGAGILGTIGTGPFPRPWDCRSRSSPGPQKADLRSVTGPKITRTGVDCRYCTAGPPHPCRFATLCSARVHFHFGQLCLTDRAIASRCRRRVGGSDDGRRHITFCLLLCMQSIYS